MTTRPSDLPPRAPRVETLPLDALRAAPRNPRLHDLGLLVTSLRRFGLARLPVLDDRTRRLVAGHGIVQALVRMRGADEAPPEGVTLGVRDAWCIPVRVLSFADEAEAAAYVLVDTRATEHARWDRDGLEEVLRSLDERALDLGWTDREIANLLAPVEPLLEPLEREPEPKTRQLTITFEQLAFTRMLPRLAAAQSRHRANTYAELLDTLLSLSEEAS